MNARRGVERGAPGQTGYEGGTIAGLYDLGETIGKGHYAVVKLARHVFTGEKVAVKVIDKTKLDEISRAHLFQEVRCMKLVQHPNVVRLYEVIDTQTKLYLVLEWGDGGDLYDYIMKHDRGLGEDLARGYFAQIVQAISYCHRLHVVHRDLKPENVVFFENVKVVKLTDFGFSNKFVPGRMLDTSCGSLAYSAPEILLGDSYDAPAVDIWSLGVILYMLVCGVPPFQEANDSETLTMIMDCRYRMPSHISASCQEMIGRMLVKDPSQRTVLEDIVSHPWLNAGSPLSLPQIPLVCREEMQEEDQAYIIQKIVDGNIATKQEILESLEQSEYNYITATYYLLAERLLRKRNDVLTLQYPCSQASPDLKPMLSPLVLSPRIKSPDSEVNGDRQRTPFDSLVSPPGSRQSPPSVGSLHDKTNACRCPLIHRPLMPEDNNGGGVGIADARLVIRQSLSDSRLKEDAVQTKTDDTVSGRANCTPVRLEVPPAVPRLLPPTRPVSMTGRPLFSVHSSPQLLNEIFEECESGDEGADDVVGGGVGRSHTFRQNAMIVSPDVARKFDRLHKVRPSPGQRGTSCSSSDTSDTDDIEFCRTPNEFSKIKFRRRDSSEHSSDTDGAPPGPSSLGASRRPSSTTRNQGQSRSSNKTDAKKGRERVTENNPGKSASHNVKKENMLVVPVQGVRKSVKLGDPGKKPLQINAKNGSRKVCEARLLVCPAPKEAPPANEIKPAAPKDKSGVQVIHVRSRNFDDLVQKFTKRVERCRNSRNQSVRNGSNQSQV